ncbi:putative nuclease HARBI1 [Ostrinia furnacalis]|uniref:putative nuclease HARBI1 n=1 Tax=Ostrinia furnacalis TaxID=93504 RepID=UPI00103CE1AC|nr:putative nuclease HARBI1 [Ostrinia furnacalis]XP_028165147.1 putative nuclease HARBI1 [Ostrinia furnacalis]
MDINDMDLMDFEDMDSIEPSRQTIRYIRNRRRANPFLLEEPDFKSKYRFSKRFGQKLVDLLREDLAHDPRGCPLSPELQVVCALRNWARHEIQDDTADLHGVSQPVISKTCKKVAECLSRISRRFIKMPATLIDQEESMRKFRSIAGFPMVIGAIDCTHIRIKKVSADGGQLYINRKGYPSINV